MFWKRVLFISILLSLELKQVIANLNHTLWFDLNLAIVIAKCVQICEKRFWNQFTVAVDEQYVYWGTEDKIINFFSCVLERKGG